MTGIYDITPRQNKFKLLLFIQTNKAAHNKFNSMNQTLRFEFIF